MAVKTRTTTTSNINVAAREVDFVSRFNANWDEMRAVMGISNPVRKAAGTQIVASRATVTLQDGAVAEGDEIPYSQATVTPVTTATIAIKKWAKAVTIEAVDKYGAAVAVEKTDDAFLNELQGVVLDEFYDFLGTGTLTGSATTFQTAVAKAIGLVVNKFKTARLDYSQPVVFVNTLDAYNYLGESTIATAQNLQGFQYVENYMGAVLILSSEVTAGTVYATVASNIVLYYVDPSDSEFARLGLEYTTVGETNLIGFHAEGNYSHAVGETYAIMGMKLWAEYLDGIAVVYIGTATKVTNAETITADSVDTSLYKTAHSPVISVQELKDGNTAITNYTVEPNGVRLASTPSGTVTIKYTYVAQS